MTAGIKRAPPRHARQRGVAVITALLLTTLAITIVASLFWQQQVQVRSMENQRLQLQTQWVLRGALDWANLIIRENGRLSPLADRLDQPWAVPLAETRLDDYVEKGGNAGEAGDAVLSGQIVDAQSRFNLWNLAKNGKIDPGELEAFRRLLNNLHLKPDLALATAMTVAASQPRPATPIGNQANGSGSSNTSNTEASGGTEGVSTGGNVSAGAAAGAPTLLQMSQVDDLFAVPGMTAEAFDALKDYVIIIPDNNTVLNVNTASAQVLAARIPGLALPEATALVTARDRIAFKNWGDFQARIGTGFNLTQGAGMDLKSEYFIVYGQVRLGRASQAMHALVHRSRPGSNVIRTDVVWIRED